MTEEQIRQIVRDELEAECIRENGIYEDTLCSAEHRSQLFRGPCEQYPEIIWTERR